MAMEEFEKNFKKHFQRTSSFLSGWMLMVVDAITIMLCIGITFFVINFIDNSFINFRSFVTYAIYLPLILLVFYAAGLYPGIMASPSEDVKRFCICSFFSFAGIAISIFVEDNEDRIAVAVALLSAVPIATVLLPGNREIAKHIFGRRKWWGVPAVVYCSGMSGDVVARRLLLNPYLGYKPALIIDSAARDQSERFGVPVFPPGRETLSAIKRLNIKVAILCDYAADTSEIMKSYRYTITVSKLQNTFLTGTMQLKDIGGIVGFSSTHNLTKRANLLAKRLIDIFVVLLSLPLVLPISALIALAIKLTSKGPVFYGHKRVGKNRRPIKCWKFRSMRADADKILDDLLAKNPEMRAQWEKERKLQDDPRVTPFGKFLRKTSLDELPQLWNILTGQMSLVGPRPVTEGELERYGGSVDYILSVTPGLSGMWQTSGRSDTEYEERITLDTYYIQNWSVWLDIWILIKTVWVVLRGKGAY